jgi:predicted permease
MTLTLWLGLYASVAALLLPVAACAGIGAFWGWKKRSYPGEFIATVATAVATPALVFHTLVTTRLDNALLLQVLGAGLAGLALAALMAAIVLRVAGLPVGPLVPTATFPNAGNLGLPVAQLAFGETGLAVAVAFFTVCSVMQHTLAAWWLGRVGSDSPTRPRAAWPRGVTVACLLAVAARLSGVAVPEPVLASARLVGSLAVPLMLLSLGYALVTVSRAGIGQGSVLGVVRLATGLAAGLLITLLFDLPPMVASVMQLQLLMPVAVVNYLYAERFTRFGDLAAGAVLVSTALFVLLSPLLLWWSGATHVVPLP